MNHVKYSHIVELLDSIPLTKVKEREAFGYTIGPWVANLNLYQAINVWDEIFAYILHYWDEPTIKLPRWQDDGSMKPGVLECQLMFDMDKDTLAAKVKSIPPYFSEQVFPVAVCRYLMRDLNFPSKVLREAETMPEILRRYGIFMVE